MKNITKEDKVCGCIIKSWDEFEKLVKQLCGKGMDIENEFSCLFFEPDDEDIEDPREYVYDKLSEYYGVTVTNIHAVVWNEYNTDICISYSTPYELVASDGYSVERTVYATKALANEMMCKAYKEYDNNEPGDEWDEESYLVDGSALLYAGGENVYAWEVFPCIE